MKKVLVHTPEGVRDIYNKECERKLYLQQTVHNVLKKYGYNDIQTPSFECFDIFSKEKGTVASNKMYKFFDREGNTLVLRPDMTPPMARCVSKYYMDEEMPIRLCYSGQTFINSAEHQGKLKECTQIGAELYGENKADSDCETLAIIIESLLACGLTEFQIEVGHTLFFEGLINEAKLEEEEEDELRQLVENKNFFGMEEYLSNIGMDEDLKEIFIQLPELIGSGDMIARAKKLISNEKIDTALSRLEKVYKLLSYYGYEKYVSFDLSTVANRNYYTGIIFAGYTFGTGEPVVRGGRYDRLLTYFGKNAPSIGFAIVVDQLMAALSRQKIFLTVPEESILLIYRKEKIEPAIRKAQKLRQQGKIVTLIPVLEGQQKEYYINYAMKNHIAKVDFMDEQA